MHHSLFLLGEFTRRDFKGRYAGSVMGQLRSFAQLLRSLANFTFLFSTVMKVSPRIGKRAEHFAIFFCGLLWQMAVQTDDIRDLAAPNIDEVLTEQDIVPVRPIVRVLGQTPEDFTRPTVVFERVGY